MWSAFRVLWGFFVTLGTERFRNSNNFHILKDRREQNDDLCKEPPEVTNALLEIITCPNWSCGETDRAPYAAINIQHSKIAV